LERHQKYKAKSLNHERAKSELVKLRCGFRNRTKLWTLY